MYFHQNNKLTCVYIVYKHNNCYRRQLAEKLWTLANKICLHHNYIASSTISVLNSRYHFHRVHIYDNGAFILMYEMVLLHYLCNFLNDNSGSILNTKLLSAQIFRNQYHKRQMSKGPCKILLTPADFVFPQTPDSRRVL